MWTPQKFLYQFKFEICDGLHHLAPFAQSKKCEKHPWRNVTFGIVAG